MDVTAQEILVRTMYIFVSLFNAGIRAKNPEPLKSWCLARFEECEEVLHHNALAMSAAFGPRDTTCAGDAPSIESYREVDSALL